MTIEPTYTLFSEKMHVGIKEEWVAALRDPNAKQIQNYLKTSEGNCCLGIACEVAIKNKVIPDATLAGFARCSESNVYTYEGRESYLPRKVSNWMGFMEDIQQPSFHIKYKNVVGERKTESFHLTDLNDHGFTFAQIADLIEYMF